MFQKLPVFICPSFSMGSCLMNELGFSKYPGEREPMESPLPDPGGVREWKLPMELAMGLTMGLPTPVIMDVVGGIIAPEKERGRGGKV